MKSQRIPYFILALLCLDAIVVAIYLVNARLGLPLDRFTHQHDLNTEGNFPTWLSSIKYLLAAALLWFSVKDRIRKAEVRTWLLAFFPLVLVALSCDEVAQIHESLGRRADVAVLHHSREGTMFANTGVWTLVIGIPAAVLIIGALFAIGRSTFWKTGALWRFSLGIAVMFVGALGFETLSNFLPLQGGAVEIAFEEYFEMLGATLMLWAAHDQAKAELAEMIEIGKANAGTAKASEAAPTRRAA